MYGVASMFEDIHIRGVPFQATDGTYVFPGGMHQAAITAFKKWAKRNGMKPLKIYPGESTKRAVRYEFGIYTAQVINRVTLHHTHPDYKERRKKFLRQSGHFRHEAGIITECTVAVFINGLGIGHFSDMTISRWMQIVEGRDTGTYRRIPVSFFRDQELPVSTTADKNTLA